MRWGRHTHDVHHIIHHTRGAETEIYASSWCDLALQVVQYWDTPIILPFSSGKTFALSLSFIECALRSRRVLWCVTVAHISLQTYTYMQHNPFMLCVQSVSWCCCAVLFSVSTQNWFFGRWLLRMHHTRSLSAHWFVDLVSSYKFSTLSANGQIMHDIGGGLQRTNCVSLTCTYR